MIALPTEKPVALKHGDQIRFGKSLNPDDCPAIFKVELKHPDVFSPATYAREPYYDPSTRGKIDALVTRIRNRAIPASETRRYGLPQSLLYDDEDDKPPFERTRSGSAASAEAPRSNILDLLQSKSEPLVVPCSPPPVHLSVNDTYEGVLPQMSMQAVPLVAEDNEGPEVRGLYDTEDSLTDLPGLALYHIFNERAESTTAQAGDEHDLSDDDEEGLGRSVDGDGSDCGMSEHVSERSESDVGDAPDEDDGSSDCGSMDGQGHPSSSVFESESDHDSELSQVGSGSEDDFGNDSESELSYDSMYDHHRCVDSESEDENDQASVFSEPYDPPSDGSLELQSNEVVVVAAVAAADESAALPPSVPQEPVANSTAPADLIESANIEVVVSVEVPTDAVPVEDEAAPVPAPVLADAAVQATAEVEVATDSAGELRRIITERLEQELADTTTYGDTSAFAVNQKLRAQAEVALDKARGQDPIPVPAPDVHPEPAPPADLEDFVVQDWMKITSSAQNAERESPGRYAFTRADGKDDRPRTPSLAGSDGASVSDDVLVTPVNRHKRKLSDELAEDTPASPPKKTKEARKGRDLGMVLLGAAIGAVGTIAGLLQMAD